MVYFAIRAKVIFTNKTIEENNYELYVCRFWNKIVIDLQINVIFEK